MVCMSYAGGSYRDMLCGTIACMRQLGGVLLQCCCQVHLDAAKHIQALGHGVQVHMNLRPSPLSCCLPLGRAGSEQAEESKSCLRPGWVHALQYPRHACVQGSASPPSCQVVQATPQHGCHHVIMQATPQHGCGMQASPRR